MASVHFSHERFNGGIIEKLKALLASESGTEGVREGDRFRFGSILLVGPINGRGTESILVQWPDGHHEKLKDVLFLLGDQEKVLYS